MQLLWPLQNIIQLPLIFHSFLNHVLGYHNDSLQTAVFLLQLRNEKWQFFTQMYTSTAKHTLSWMRCCYTITSWTACSNLSFRSEKIGSYELPFKEFHNIKLVFQNASKLFCQENNENFLLTKFLYVGANIKLRRLYRTDGLQVDIKLKPAVNISFGRLDTGDTMASFMFCDDQVRINHFYMIDAEGNVSYNLKSKPKVDENHDVDLVVQCTDEAIVCSIDWNGKWQGQIAMSSKALIIHWCDNGIHWRQIKNVKKYKRPLIFI